MRNAAGFTLIEVAIALFLLAVLFGGIVVPLRMQVELRMMGETQHTLGKAREALLGYAVAHGHFPCPADETSNGLEPAGTDHGTGTCPTYHGFLPAALLGLQAPGAQGYALDAWGARPANRIRYAVSNETIGPLTNTNALTRTNGMRTAGISRLGDPGLSLFHVCGSSLGVIPGVRCGLSPPLDRFEATLASNAPVVLWSVGPNGASGGASPHEAENPNPNGGSADRIFVSRARSTVAGSEFDDIVTWIPMPLLISRMATAGHLP